MWLSGFGCFSSYRGFNLSIWYYAGLYWPVLGQIQFSNLDRKCKTCLDTKPVLYHVRFCSSTDVTGYFSIVSVGIVTAIIDRLVMITIQHVICYSIQCKECKYSVKSEQNTRSESRFSGYSYCRVTWCSLSLIYGNYYRFKSWLDVMCEIHGTRASGHHKTRQCSRRVLWRPEARGPCISHITASHD